MRSLAPLVLVWVLTASGPGAQTPAAPAAQATPDGSTVTATGCLRSGEQSGTFVLTNAKWEPKSGQNNEMAATGETLRLASLTTRLKLNEHVGHTVSLTGMLAGEDRIVTPGIVLPDAPATSRKPEVSGKPPSRVFNVRNVTHVSAECK